MMYLQLVIQDHHDAHQNVHDAHNRNKLCKGVRYAFRAAAGDDVGQDGDKHADDDNSFYGQAAEMQAFP